MSMAETGIKFLIGAYCVNYKNIPPHPVDHLPFASAGIGRSTFNPRPFLLVPASLGLLTFLMQHILSKILC